MAYEKIGFTDNVTPLDAENMNHIEDGISENSDAVEALNNDLTDINIFRRGTAITSGDLNDYTTYGNYYCSGASAAQNIDNTPTDQAFKLLVLDVGYNDAGSRCVQIFLCNSSATFIYARILLSSGWSNWVAVASITSTTSLGEPVVMGEDDA